jgi:acetyl-CoA acetyltransferase
MSNHEAHKCPAIASPPTEALRRVLRAMAAWASACTDYYRAARHYESIWKTASAELARLGISRRTLAQTLCETHDRAWRAQAEQKPEPNRSEHASAELAADDSPVRVRAEEQTGPRAL